MFNMESILLLNVTFLKSKIPKDLLEFFEPAECGECYVCHMVEVFRFVRELLAEDGTLWLVIGDSYAGSWGNYGGQNRGNGTQRKIIRGSEAPNSAYDGLEKWRPPTSNKQSGLKPKDLCMIPARVALALQADGWYLRSEITWCKRAPMPESVQDRPTSATEKIFLLSKNSKYYYNAKAVRETSIEPNWESRLMRASEKSKPTDKVNGIRQRIDKQRGHSRRHTGFNDRWDAMDKSEQQSGGRNMRNWWLLGPESYTEAHFATFPSEIPKRCVLAGSRPGDIILDPFFGSGTTGMVAEQLGRQWIGCELQKNYEPLQKQRTAQTGMVIG